jgi:hypothetical protein
MGAIYIYILKDWCICQKVKKIDVFSLYYKLDNLSFNESKNISFSYSKDKRE